MPIIIGYMFGKVLGNLIVAIVSILLRVLSFVCVLAFRLLGLMLKVAGWFLGIMWEGAKDLYHDYRLNYK